MIGQPDRGAAEPEPATGSALKAAALGSCPRCGAASMFAGPVQFSDRCRKCGFDYTGFDLATGAAAGLTLLIGAVLAVAAIVFDQMVHPPLWLHVVLWVPVTAAMVAYGLRLAKGAALTMEYRRSACEARAYPPGELSPVEHGSSEGRTS